MVSTNKCFVPSASSQRWRRFQSTRTSLLSFKRRWLTAQIFVNRFSHFHWLLPALIFHFEASEFSIRTQLKTVKKKEFAMDEGEAEARFIHLNYLTFIYCNKMGRLWQVKLKTTSMLFSDISISINLQKVCEMGPYYAFNWRDHVTIFFVTSNVFHPRPRSGRCKWQPCSTRHSLVSFIHLPCRDFC